MFRNYFVTAIRNIWRNKSYSAISILGLSIGMAVFFLILSFILFETNYESAEKNSGKIFNLYWGDKTQQSVYSSTPYVLAKVFRNNYSSIAECAQVSEEYDYGRLRVVHNNMEYLPENVFYAEPQLFNILTFKVSTGSIDNFNANINSVLISESAAQKYYNGENILGKTIQIKSADNIENFLVSGIIKDRPINSQLRPDFIFTMSYFKSKMPAQFIDDWGVNNPTIYFKLKKGVEPNQLLTAIKNIQTNLMPEFRKEQIFNIISLKDVHLHTSHVFGFFGKKGSIQKVYIFAFIGLLILILACINFINLTTARASQRVKEIGIRKILGANKQRLLAQITTESILFSLLSLPFAVLFTEVTSKYFYETLGCGIKSFPLFEVKTVLFLIGIPILVGFLSGLYTSYYSIKSISANDIQGRTRVVSTNTFLRKMLIGFQFIVFTGLLICSVITYKQINFMTNDDLGYDKNNILILDQPDIKYSSSMRAFINELKTHNCIIDASNTSSLPPAVGSTITTYIVREGNTQKRIEAQLITCDENFIRTMGLKLLEGNNFKNSAENSNEIIINKLAAKRLGFKNITAGESILIGKNRYKIAGVINNFYSLSFYQPLMPIILKNSTKYSYKIAVNYRPQELQQALSVINRTWKDFFNGSVLNTSFSDKELQKVYDNDIRFSKTIFLFTIVSIFISVIGLASLVAITTSKRKKEIGVRKVLGASVLEIIIMLSKETVIISLISTIIACPLAFYLTDKWLSNYVYKVELTVFYPVIAFIVGLFISLLTVSIHAYKTANTNPVESLRYE